MTKVLRLTSFLIALVTPVILADNVLVKTVNGIVKGYTERTTHNQQYYSFRGVKYAESPGGENRFRAPIPKKHWTGIFDATKNGPVCPQISAPSSSEDCLLLNIFTKNLTAQQPVMVWIHGGGFSTGDANFNPIYLLDRDDIVFVPIQFRHGPLGFFTTEDANAPGNAALKDQNLALKWVRDNIRNFGGNPNLVTIFGQSSGAISITAHVASPLSKGLFHRAIALSGSGVTYVAAESPMISYETAKNLGCPLDNSTVIVHCVKSKSTEEIIGAGTYGHDARKAIFGWNYVIEDPSSEAAFLTEDPTEIMKSGRFNAVPIMTGFTANELESSHVLDADLLKEYNDNFKTMVPVVLMYPENPNADQITEKIRSFYFGDQSIDETTSKALQHMLSDAVTYGIHRFANLTQQYQNVYYYEFNYLGRYPHGFAYGADGSSPEIDVRHGSELQYLFPSKNFPIFTDKDPEYRMVQKMTGWFTNFAKYGTPNGQDDPWISDVKWAPSNANQLAVFSLDDPAKSFSVEPLHSRFEIFDTLFPIV